MKADEKVIKNLFNQLKNQGEDPEKIKYILDSYLQKRMNPSIGTTKKAALTDNIMHQIIGEAALDEIEGLSDMSLQQAAEKSKEVSNKGISKLEKALDISPKISVEDLSAQRAQGMQHPSFGVKLDKRFDVPDTSTKQLGLGTLFHEGGHSLDDVAKRMALAEDEMIRRSSPTYKEYFLKKSAEKNFRPTVLQMMNDDEFNRYYSQAKDAFNEYTKNNPGKLEGMIKDSGVTKFSSQPVPDILPNEFKDFTPTQLQNLYSGSGHWFKRNFPFENLKNVLKSGVKGIRSLAPFVGPAAGALGAYQALKSGDAAAATLNAAAAIDPTGVADAAAEVNRRLKLSPEEVEKQRKEDYYSAMPAEIANEQRMLDELDDTSKFKKLKNKLK